MEVFASLWWAVALAFVLVMPLTLWLPFYMAAKARGIEGALREIAFELKLSRVAGEQPLPPLLNRSGEVVPPPTGMVSTSMFGR